MKKGFTLIELLAVIVILAIIALIAVPIVLNIIDETKSNATLRSADFYLRAAELSISQATLKEQNISDGVYKILGNGNICLEYKEEKCINELKVEINGEVPDSGTITINNNNIKNIDFNLNKKRITQNSDGEIIYFPCDLINGEKNVKGSKYICEVSPGIKYNFYILSFNSDDGTTNLIMDRNICEDGTATNSSKEEKCLVAWNTSGNNTEGPVNAMDYLYNATKNWVNIPNIIMDYTDENVIYSGFSDIAPEGTTGNIPSGNYNVGDEYLCTVDPNKPAYTFFILSKEENKINLIMDSNIRTGGEPVKEENPTEEQKGLVAWLSEADFNEIATPEQKEAVRNDNGPCQHMNEGCVSTSPGPVTAMNYLNEATKTWTNTSSLYELYDDEGGNFKNFKITGYARMPKVLELETAGCDKTYDGTFEHQGKCPLWLANYTLKFDSNNPLEIVVNGVTNYMTLSTSTFQYGIYSVFSYYLNPETGTSYYPDLGIRPVITLKI